MQPIDKAILIYTIDKALLFLLGKVAILAIVLLCDEQVVGFVTIFSSFSSEAVKRQHEEWLKRQKKYIFAKMSKRQKNKQLMRTKNEKTTISCLKQKSSDKC